MKSPQLVLFAISCMLVTTLAGCTDNESAQSPPHTLVALVNSRNDHAQLDLNVVDPTNYRKIRTLSTNTTGTLSLTPDGNTVYFTTATGPSGCRIQLWKTAVDGKTPPELLPYTGIPSVSPDGTKIAYLDLCSSPVTLKTRNLADDTEHEVAKSTEQTVFQPDVPSWSPDGKRLVATTTHETSRFRVARTFDVNHTVSASAAEIAFKQDNINVDNPIFVDSHKIAFTRSPDIAGDFELTSRWSDISVAEIGAKAAEVLVNEDFRIIRITALGNDRFLASNETGLLEVSSKSDPHAVISNGTFAAWK